MPTPDPRKRSLGAAGASAQPAGPAAAPVAGAAPAAAPATPATQQPAGTGFVNLATVLAANRQGAQQMGQQLAGRVRQQGQQAQQAVQAGQDKFNAAVTAGTPTFNAGDYNNRPDLRAAAARGYTGPKDWAAAGVDVAALAAQTNAAQDAAQALTSQGGRAALLREQAPGLTAGGASLDAFLAGQGMGSQGQEVAQGFGSLADQLRTAREGSGARVDAALADTAAASQRAKDLEQSWDDQDMQYQLDQTRAENEAYRRQRRTPNRRDTTDYRSP